MLNLIILQYFYTFVLHLARFKSLRARFTLDRMNAIAQALRCILLVF